MLHWKFKPKTQGCQHACTLRNLHRGRRFFPCPPLPSRHTSPTAQQPIMSETKVMQFKVPASTGEGDKVLSSCSPTHQLKVLLNKPAAGEGRGAHAQTTGHQGAGVTGHCKHTSADIHVDNIHIQPMCACDQTARMSSLGVNPLHKVPCNVALLHNIINATHPSLQH